MTAHCENLTLMRIYIGESDRHGHQPLYEVLLDLFHNEGCRGATVIRGIAGFGSHGQVHSDRLLRLSGDLPLIVEAVDYREKLEAIMPKVDAMLQGGMITLEQVTVISQGGAALKPGRQD